jgi:hypothetical protein
MHLFDIALSFCFCLVFCMARLSIYHRLIFELLLTPQIDYDLYWWCQKLAEIIVNLQRDIGEEKQEKAKVGRVTLTLTLNPKPNPKPNLNSNCNPIPNDNT